MTTSRVLSSDTLQGTQVKNPRGEDIGSVKELMINTQSGKVEYVVLSFGGFMGLGDKLFAVPYNAFAIDKNEEELILDVDKEYLKNAPGFDKDNWPDFAAPEFQEQHHTYYKPKYVTR